MSTANSTPERQQAGTQPVADPTAAMQPKTPRVLACLLCQQRKVKCDRKFPCAHCVRHSVQCVPAALVPRQRRRRFPERELLERLRHYESLLRQNNIDFEPLHGGPPAPVTPTEHTSPCDSLASSDARPEAPRPSQKTTQSSKLAVDFLRAINRVTLNDNTEDHEEDSSDSDGNSQDARLRDSFRLQDTLADAKNTLENTDIVDGDRESDDHLLLLFASPRPDVHLSALHPGQAQIFRLWQVYLDNVNPLLKVTHTTSLQPRIIDAVSDLTNIDPALEALIFSIYCISVSGLDDSECRTLFGSSKSHLLAGYQFACQQALQKSKALRCSDYDNLTALYLFMVSCGSPNMDPRPLSSILAVAIRIAQRMGMHSESSYAKWSSVEAEMRRRLWWSLVIFDHRICEMSEYKSTTLTPTWDCAAPLNVSDFEIRKEMKILPETRQKPTEALFVVVRSELADFIRHSAFHLNFINPALNTIAQPKYTSVDTLEKAIEDRYFSFCDPEDPLHFMTIWTTRVYVARLRLLGHYSRYSMPSIQQTDAERNQGFSYALAMLEFDTKLVASPLTRAFHWLVDFHVPGLAYNHILNDLRWRPAEDHAQKAWDIMSNNYAARAMFPSPDQPNIIAVFSRVVLNTWGVCEAFYKQQGRQLEPPHIVMQMRKRMTEMSLVSPETGNTGQISADLTSILPPFDLGGHGAGGQSFTSGVSPDMPGQMISTDMDQFWDTVDWQLMHTQTW